MVLLFKCSGLHKLDSDWKKQRRSKATVAPARLHASFPLIYITASPPRNLFLSSPVKHFPQATVSITSLSSNHPPTSTMTPSSPVLSFSTLLCRIGEAYCLATTIKVQQVSGGSCHHQSKLRKPYCDRRIYARREEKSPKGRGGSWS